MGKQKQIRYKILAVDDNKNTLEIIQRNLEGAGYDISVCTSVEDAVNILEFNPIDLVISDIKMPVINGMDLLKYVKDNFSDNIEIMMITGYPDVNGAVKVIKEGAEDYLVKPFTDEELLFAVRQMIEKLENRRVVQSEKRLTESYGIIGESEEMRKAFDLIDKAASTLANVLISGESGTGKELVARAIHYSSDRSTAPFVSVNCTAIPDTLLESELFGHVKGAFTGAKDSRAGYFQIADGGTILLDEIGDASLSLQGKLLRVLQNKEIHVVGSSRVRKVDTRIIAATHKDLKTMISKKYFREDLYYRLDVIDIPVPPLRERSNDVLMLVNYFLEKFSKESDRSAPLFSDNALQALKNYSWPGNVRELENLIQRMVVMIDSNLIDVADLPSQMRFSISRKKGNIRTLAEVEAEHISNVLMVVDGNKTRAAEILGIDRKTLRKKIQKSKKSL